KDWTPTLPDAQIIQSTIEISASARREGAWLAGIPLKGHKKMNLIDYYFFKGKGETPAPYWQPIPLLKKEINKGLVYYKAPDLTLNYSMKELSELTNFPYFSAVLTDRHTEIIVPGLIITGSNTKNETLKRDR